MKGDQPSLHAAARDWCLDVTFRGRERRANLGAVPRVAASLLKRDPGKVHRTDLAAHERYRPAGPGADPQDGLVAADAID